MSVRPSFATGVAWLLLLLANVGTAAMEPVTLRASQDVDGLAPFTRYSVDPGLKASAEDEFSRLDSDAFQPLPHGNATFGFVDGAYWFHVRLRNDDARSQQRILVLDYALLDQIDAYLRHDDGSIEHFISGDFHPFNQRFLRYRSPNFLLALGANEQADLLVRVQSKSSMQVPLTLYTQKAFFESTRDVQLGVGIYYGILLALLLYNLILFITLRDANYFYYVVYVGGFGIAQLCLNGLAFEYLWPDSPQLANLAIPLSMAFGMLVMHQFVRVFLDLEHRLPIGNRIALGFIGFHLVMLVLSPFVDYRFAVFLGTAAVLPGAAAILSFSLILARRGDLAARILLLAWTVLLIGTASYAMVSFGVLPKIFITEFGMQIGSALELILLSFALGLRFATLRSENIRIVQTARRELEVRVDERTRELSTTLGELAIANDRLRESSLRDGLTGVYNRRHFEASYDSTLRESQAAGHNFGILVADIDHFKRVNDEAGHLVGDDCLRLSAAIIDEQVGDNGQVIRYGGEEFVALLADTDADSLANIAESIRAEISNRTSMRDVMPIPLTISIGTALARPDDEISSTALLQRADAAMYKAKHDGRNRVVAA